MGSMTKTVKASLFGFLLLVSLSCGRQEEVASPLSRPADVSTAPSQAASLLVPPKEGMYLGAYASYDDGSAQSLGESLSSFETISGRTVVWAIVFNEWPGLLHFPKDEATTLHRQGTTPFIRVLPRSVPWQTNELDPVIRMDRINAGDYDDQIRQWARDARDIGFPLLVEFGPEANGFWNQWSGVLYPNGPALYASVYRRFVSICRAEGANNITWFFHMNGDDNPERPDNQMAQFYPGDDYIDWIGVSVLGAQQVTDYWDLFIDVMDRAYGEISAVSRTKPIALVETAVVEDPKLADHKAQWFQSAFAELESGRWPRLKAYSYWDEPGWLKEVNDLRFNSSAASLAAFREGVADPFFVSVPVWGGR